MKYDKTSIEFRKEYERLSKKSKGEYESLERNDKAELFRREGLPSKMVAPKARKFNHVRENKILKTQRNDLVQDTEVKNISLQERSEMVEDIKTKPRLHEQGVISIRPNNCELKVVMQGKKIDKKSDEKAGCQIEEGKVRFIM